MQRQAHSKLRGRVTISLLIAGLTGSCAQPRPRLTGNERQSCVAQGGYESRGPFGSPFCQFNYSDAGKVCSAKADCQGKCLLPVSGPPNSPVPQPGERAQGMCEATRSTFGCYAEIDNGAVTSEGSICVD